jgi:hypothetical protein
MTPPRFIKFESIRRYTEGKVAIQSTHHYIGNRTSARQYFHTDAADVVGLLCLHKAMEGGESDVVSAHNLWNTLQAERPDVAELLTRPDWYFDRKGEVSDGQKPWVQKAVSTRRAQTQWHRN